MNARPLVWFVLIAAACARDVAEGTSRRTTRPELSLATASADSAGHETRSLTLSDGGTGLVIGSFRIAVHYDSLRVRFVGVAGADTMSVAVNDIGGRVLIAGASARGLRSGEWLSLHFERKAGAAGAFGVEVLELGDLHGLDVRSTVIATPEFGRAK